MALQDILTAINENTKREIAEIDRVAADKVAVIEHDGAARFSEAREARLARATMQATQNSEQLVERAASAVRNTVLAAKQDVLRDAFAKAEKALAALDEDEQITIVTELMKQLPRLSDGTIHPAKGAESIMKKAAHAAGVKLAVSNETVPGSGGFTVTSTTIDIDNRYGALLMQEHDTLESEAAKTLFATEQA